MTQTNRSFPASTRNPLSHRPIFPILLTILLSALLMSACNASVGAGGRTGTTRVGGSVGSSGSVVGIGTSVGPGVAVSTSGDLLINGPSQVRTTHRSALKDLKKGNYDAAAAVFEKTLQQYPTHPDATYFLGLARIYQGQREAGYALLKSYKDPDFYRMTTEVQRTAKLLEQKPNLSAQKVRDTMNRNRNDGYNQDVREHREMTTWK